MEDFAKLVPDALLSRSGKVFYSGRAAFSRPGPLYILGINPGGNPDLQWQSTIGKHLDESLARESLLWSEYADGVWEGAAAGTWGMQPRIQHFCNQLKLDVRSVAASNLIFVRTARESKIGPEKRALIEQCWPFHAAVVEKLKPRIIVCLGKTAGLEVRVRTDAHKRVETFVEQNRRRWKSTVHQSATGLSVATLTHPSVAAWPAPATDPSQIVGRHLR